MDLGESAGVKPPSQKLFGRKSSCSSVAIMIILNITHLIHNVDYI